MGSLAFVQPLRHCFAMPPLLLGAALAYRKVSPLPGDLSSSPEAPLQGATATTAASGGNREELLGQRPAGCERQRSRRWEPQPGQCHRRWRRGQARLSRVIYTAMSIGFCQSDAIAVFFCFSVASLPSQSRFARQLPQRGSLWRDGQTHAGRAKFLYIENRSALLQRLAAA